ncbi:MAG: hypothetical protein K6E22_11605 [Treponema sp.]|nr:hypothetical protein [Treponema sp.]
MKKTLAAILTTTAILATALFTSCHDPIFESISNEVELETNGLRGDIRSIVPFNNYIYCCNNMIYRKPALASYEGGGQNKQWREVSTSFTDGTITFLASDSSYIYALAIEWEADESEGKNLPSKAAIYASSDGNTWNKVTVPDANLNSIDEDYDLVLFDNQEQSYSSGGTISTSGRIAYFGFYDDSIETGRTFRLSGTSATLIDAGTKYCKAAGDKFSTYSAFARKGSMYYWGKSGDDEIYWGTNPADDSNSIDLDCGIILSISVTADHLLLGTARGIQRVPIDASGNITGNTRDFKSGNNALSILTGRVLSTYVLDSSKPESETDEYAGQVIYGSITSSSISFDEVGLFAYYPERNTWNRDGTDSSSSDGN